MANTDCVKNSNEKIMYAIYRWLEQKNRLLEELSSSGSIRGKWIVNILGRNSSSDWSAVCPFCCLAHWIPPTAAWFTEFFQHFLFCFTNSLFLIFHGDYSTHILAICIEVWPTNLNDRERWKVYWKKHVGFPGLQWWWAPKCLHVTFRQ